MTKLTDTQLVLLSAAAQRDDHIIAICERLKGAVAKTVGAKLIALGLAAEAEIDDVTPFWRLRDDDQRLGLIITPQGLAAIGLSDDPENEGEPQIGQGAAPASSVTNGRTAASAPALGAPLANTKNLAMALLQEPEGASISQLTKATGWLPHSARAFLSGLRKQGLAVERSKNSSGVTRYRITNISGAGVPEQSLNRNVDPTEPDSAAFSGKSKASAHSHEGVAVVGDEA